MAPMLLKTLAPMALLALSARLDYKDPNVLKGIQLVFLVSITSVNFGLYFLKAMVEKKNEIGRTVRVTDAEGKVETKTVLTYDVDAINTLFTQSIVVRAVAQQAAHAAHAALNAGGDTQRHIRSTGTPRAHRAAFTRRAVVS
jgi:hypothetical protein